MGCCFSCFDGGNKEERKEEERLASAEARAKAAEAAQRRQEQFEQSAAGRAARAQMQGAAKQSAKSNKDGPVLKALIQESGHNTLVNFEAARLQTRKDARNSKDQDNWSD